MYGDIRYENDTTIPTTGNNDDIMYGGDMHGEAGNDIMYGDDGNDVLFGGIGNDHLFGGADSDELCGDAGDDILCGGTGSDMLKGGEGVDLASYETATSGVVVKLIERNSNNSMNTGDAAGDTFESVEGLIGSAYDDQLIGDALSNYLFGGADSDELCGDAGDDILCGGTGSDMLKGGEGVDLASYETATSGVVVKLTENNSNNSMNTGDAAGDTFESVEGLIGSAYDDQLIGDALSNYVNGGAGNDVMLGNSGYDYLIGGSGNDTYQFVLGSEYDHIFEAANGGVDSLYLKNITQIGVYRQDNHLLFAANNDDVIVLDNWFVNAGVEYIAFEALQQYYLVSDFADLAVTIQSEDVRTTNGKNVIANMELDYISPEGQQFKTTDVTILGLSPASEFVNMVA